ncbi:hypothetical protein BDV32DRAFT_150454 [Aspergillus pseudonomiae]|uniref:Uncharacterized protein n=1 Tax=Aspergillus pseudonomiae TaxID=1506151 RepID=A0A5N6HYI2_9EURO|nr:uncharacterized protein BDV37DRAFT_279203 [Aspergillus pseudonomiae]KAB8259338.1 hypothetical protein BDV32DRAFT_150454 [Aspergillus pseudonomiae]KAE8408259.1 hypothetical protein BDV37DRAFT_279203 [Aspergillus pseudonomiae]
MRRLYKPESMQYLLTTLARKKREGLGQYGKEKGKDERASTASVELLKALHWQFEKKTDETPMALQGQDLRDRMLHHIRKQTGKQNTGIYGIATDSFKWTLRVKHRVDI